MYKAELKERIIKNLEYWFICEPCVPWEHEVNRVVREAQQMVEREFRDAKGK